MTPSRFHRGSCLGAAIELRITKRCLEEDFALPGDTTFEVAHERHEIVKAFAGKRLHDPRGTKTVGPAAGEHTLYHLGRGHDHRGATWFDEQENVVWLCASGVHRSGTAGDAFQKFPELIAAGQIRPTEDDYRALFTDRGHRFAETVERDAAELLSQARERPEVEQRGVVGGDLTAGVVVDIYETLEETHLAFSVTGLDYARIAILLRAFHPEAEFAEWELVDRLPARDLDADRAEIAYRILRG